MQGFLQALRLLWQNPHAEGFSLRDITHQSGKLWKEQDEFYVVHCVPPSLCMEALTCSISHNNCIWR